MTVKVTLEFDNVDLAIVALAKLSKADGTTIVDGKPRKGRADKGKPRGPHQTPGAPEAPEPKAAAPAEQERTDNAATLPPKAAPAEAHKAIPSGEVPPVAAASSASEADAQAVLEKLFAAQKTPEEGINVSRDVLSRFGVRRLRDLKADQRGEFVAAVNAVLAGGKP